MDALSTILGLLALALAGAGVWLLMERGRLGAALAGAEAQREEQRAARTNAEAEVARLNEVIGQARASLAAIDEKLKAEIEARRSDRDHWEKRHRTEIQGLREQKDALDRIMKEFDERTRTAFGALAGEALRKTTTDFLTLAEQKFDAKRGAVDDLVKPIAETLKRTGEKLAIIEQAGNELRGETGRLVRALREPHVRGRYGEIQLKRVAELAGMSAYCDFAEQEQSRGLDGTALRPDMVVKLPSDRVIVVDAKTNIQAYMDALSAKSPEEADGHLDRFARHVAEQATALARKKYWTQYDGSPEFVVMFIPGDQFVDAALSRQPELLERAAEQGVILASPATLIGLLRAVAVGYKEQTLAKAAEELRGLGKELHERVATALGHAARLGKSLNAAVESFNDFVGSYERRVEPHLRRFEETGVKSAKELPALPAVVVRAKEPPGGVGTGEMLPGIGEAEG